MRKTIILVVQKWGNGLALRIPSKLAEEQRLSAGQLVEVLLQALPTSRQNCAISTLEQLLGQFNPTKHGGEAMATTAIGVEAM